MSTNDFSRMWALGSCENLGFPLSDMESVIFRKILGFPPFAQMSGGINAVPTPRIKFDVMPSMPSTYSCL